VFRKLPVILIGLIVILTLITPHLSIEIKQMIYAISLTVKSIILLLLPIVIFSLLFNTMVNLAKGATSIIALILLCVCCSNFLSTFVSHFVGMWVYDFNFTLISPHEADLLIPAWSWEFPKLINNDKAMFLGIFIGLILSRFQPPLAAKIALRLNTLVEKTLQCFVLLIILFVSGFVVKMQADGTMQTILKDYKMIFLVIFAAQFAYIIFAYAALNYFKPGDFINNIKNMLPASIAGFSTMSSASVMPLTIVGAEMNARQKPLVRSIIPATVNIHLVGDCFAIPIFAYAIMKSFGVAEPSLLTYLIFMFYFVLAKFSVAAIPGGGIVVMLPILESCLGFNSEMLSLITALYILFDPVITSANVLGNGMFAKLIDTLAPVQVNRALVSQ
jgi:Na+/H+-dicarboxylate symporter